MNRYVCLLLLSFAVALSVQPLAAQDHAWNESTEPEEKPLFTEHFSAEEFAERRDRVYEEIGPDAFAVIQGAPMPPGFQFFRQNNEFYYLSGIESPYAYLFSTGVMAQLPYICRTEMNGGNMARGKYSLFKMQNL